MFINLVMEACSSLRGAAQTLALMSPWLPGEEQMPTAATGQSWLLRMGLYAIEQKKPRANDWAWIVDHTIQLGRHKVLLLVGVRLGQWQKRRRPLEHHDLKMLLLEPTTHSTGEVVQQQLQQAVTKTGPPRMILSDGGPDLKRGIELFCQDYEQTAAVSDIKHQVACQIKRELNGNVRWNAFLHSTNEAKTAIRQTELAHLMPPPPHMKARFMNADGFVTWGSKTLRYLQQCQSQGAEQLPRLQEKLGWLLKFGKDLAQWEEMLQVVTTVLEYIRQEGYYPEAAENLAHQLPRSTSVTPAGRVAKALLEFVQRQSEVAHPGEHLLASSEVLESLIGKGKRLQGQHQKGGITKMILSTAAAVLTPTLETVQKALTTIKTHDVITWAHQKLGPSLTTQRRLAYAHNGTKTG